MRPVAGAVLVAAMLAASAAGRTEARQDYGAIRRQLADWLALVDGHRPGAPDDAILAIARWPATRLGQTISLVQELAGFVDVDTLALRGAMLHLDAVLFGVAQPAGPIPRGLARPGLSSMDSRGGARMTTSVHLSVGRALLDEITPRNRDDAVARLWYRATTAWLARHYKLADVKEHLDKAARVFSDDAATIFDRGCLYEAFASRRVQALLATTRTTGVTFDVPDERSGLVEASRAYRDALDLDPLLVEARIRLGRVLTLIGRRDLGVVELGQALAEAERPDSRYDANLFLGRAAEDEGRLDEARARFEAARQLFPRAQSAGLALARLAGRTGDGQAEAREVEQVLNLAWEPASRDDPWWSYHEGVGRDADVLIAELRRRVTELPR